MTEIQFAMNRSGRLVRAVAVGSWLLLLVLVDVAAAEPVIRLQHRQESDPAQVVVRGIPSSELRALKTSRLDRDGWFEVLSLHVVGETSARPPVLGSHRVDGELLVFTPRFPLRPGLDYRAVYRPPTAGAGAGRSIEAVLSLPSPAAGPATQVAEAYPTSSKLPENLLKLYLHFSAPMRRGRSYQHVELFELDSSGKRRLVEAPFVEFGEELWDRSGRRLTVLFDPGRIKRGLKPRQDAGPALQAGRSYLLVINSDWRDAQGNPLATTFRKRFDVVPADTTQPDIDRWKVSPPPAHSTEPLRIKFHESLDHAMLHRVVRVQDATGSEVLGAIEVTRHETEWSLIPDRAWSPGGYQVVIEPTLEDLAGNSLARPFEVRLDEPGTATIDNDQQRVLTFKISAAR